MRDDQSLQWIIYTLPNKKLKIDDLNSVWKPAQFEVQSCGGEWHAAPIVFVKKYTLVLWFLAFLWVKELGKMFLQMSVCLFQIISRLDCQSKFQISTLRLHAGLCEFAQNISINIRSLGRQREQNWKSVLYLSSITLHLHVPKVTCY